MSNRQIPGAIDGHFSSATSGTFKFHIPHDAFAIFVPFAVPFRHIQIGQIGQKSITHRATAAIGQI